MKLKEMPFTKETLKIINASPEIIDLCERNGLFCDTLIKNFGKPTEKKTYQTCKYDAAGNLTEIVYSGGWTETWKYDIAGNLTEIIHSDGWTKTCKYDISGTLTKILYYDSGVETYKPDIIGKSIKIACSGGDITEYLCHKTKTEFAIKRGKKIILCIYNPEGWA